MNLNHLEAIAVTQKLSYSLDDKDYDAVDVCVIPPFTDLRSVQTLIDGDRLRLTYGAQDLSPETSGAFTGDISGSMLNKLGCTYVVIGHSERRSIHKESDELVNKKIKAALANELTPIFCVGEELSIREAGTQVAHVVAQVKAGLAGFHKPELKKIVIAYEPVWAIGSGRPARPETVAAVACALRSEAALTSAPLLYGGSVDGRSAAGYVGGSGAERVDGLLIGGASLEVESLFQIAAAVGVSR